VMSQETRKVRCRSDRVIRSSHTTWRRLMFMRLPHELGFGIALEAAGLFWLQDVIGGRLGVFEHLPSTSPFLVTCFVLPVAVTHNLLAFRIFVLETGV